MSGIPLVLPSAGCAAGSISARWRRTSNPGDAAGIRRRCSALLARGRSAELAEHVRQNFSWQAAAEITREAYAKIL